MAGEAIWWDMQKLAIHLFLSQVCIYKLGDHASRCTILLLALTIELSHMDICITQCEQDLRMRRKEDVIDY
jgi:hypothetical protein